MKLSETGDLAVKVNGAWQVFDTAFVYEAEARIDEVATVTKHKAPELMSYYNRAWLRLGEVLQCLERLQTEAAKRVELVRASVLLDKAEGVLREKGLRASAELREAVVSMDEEYKKEKDQLESIKAAIALFEIKQKGFEMAYLGVRKILGESAYNAKSTPIFNRGSDSTPVGNVRQQYGKASNFLEE